MEQLKNILWLDHELNKGPNDYPKIIQELLTLEELKDLHINFCLATNPGSAEVLLFQLSKVDFLIIDIKIIHTDCPGYNIVNTQRGSITGSVFIVRNVKQLIKMKVPILVYTSGDNHIGYHQYKRLQKLGLDIYFLDKANLVFDIAECIVKILKK